MDFQTKSCTPRVLPLYSPLICLIYYLLCFPQVTRGGLGHHVSLCTGDSLACPNGVISTHQDCYEPDTVQTITWCGQQVIRAKTKATTTTIHTVCQSTIKPRQEYICFYPTGQWGMSDGGGIQDQTKEKVIQQHVNTFIQNQINFTNHFSYKPISPKLTQFINQPHTHTIQAISQVIQAPNITELTNNPCWICSAFHHTSYLAYPINLTQTSAPTSPSLNYIRTLATQVALLNSTVPICWKHTGTIQTSTLNCLQTQTFNTTTNLTCTDNTTFLWCDSNLHKCLPTNHTCTPVYAFPNYHIYSPEDFESLFLPTPNPRRTIGIAVLGLASLIGLAAGTGGVATSVTLYKKLSEALNVDMDHVADTLLVLQSQINSLAAVTIRKRRALDLLLAEKGGTCMALGEECCYFVNASNIVTSKVTELKNRIEQRRRELTQSGWGLMSNRATWLYPLWGPLAFGFIILTFRPCLLRHL